MTKERKPSEWVQLNDHLRGCDLEVAQELLEEEKKGKKRKQFLIRIHGRFNFLRAEAERAELLRIADAKA